MLEEFAPLVGRAHQMYWSLPFLQARSKELYSKTLQAVESKKKELWSGLQKVVRFFDALQTLANRLQVFSQSKEKHDRSKLMAIYTNSEVGLTDFPPGLLAFPSNENFDMEAVDPKLGLASVRQRLSWLLSVQPDSFRLFSSKEAPLLLRFKCSDGKVRGLIFKKCLNSCNEAIVSNVMSTGIQSELEASKLDIRSLLPGLHRQMLSYRITPLSNTFLCLEEVESVFTISSIIERGSADKSVSSAGSDVTAQKQSNALLQYVRFFLSDLSYISWYKQQTMIHYSLAYWSAVGYVLGLGDRNLNNIMARHSGAFLYIDFECMLGLGKDLPVPEIIDVRFGPTFQQLVCIDNLYAAFRYVMLSYMRYIKENLTKLKICILEMSFHKDESLFFDKIELTREDFIAGFLDSRFAGYSREAEYGFVEGIIGQSRDERIGKLMFGGWDAKI